MAQSKITLIGLENYLKLDNHSLFDNMNLPEGIDKQTLVDTILLRCNEFEILYSDPYFMQAAIGVWSAKNYWNFEKWVNLINTSYEPLYNKDFYEETSDNHQGAASGSGSSNNSSDFTRTDNLTMTNDETDTHSEKAYNSGSSFVETAKDVIDQDQTQTGTVRNAGSGSDSYSNSSNNSYVDSHTYHGYGNIGVTAAQELFFRELDVINKANMYSQIADLFATEFCIMVY